MKNPVIDNVSRIKNIELLFYSVDVLNIDLLADLCVWNNLILLFPLNIPIKKNVGVIDADCVSAGEVSIIYQHSIEKSDITCYYDCYVCWTRENTEKHEKLFVIGYRDEIILLDKCEINNQVYVNLNRLVVRNRVIKFI
jgi:hypothetical protein